jgi:ubiquinone biosynthesis protein UbiJ
MLAKPDWEELTARWVGDVIAHRIGRGLRSLRVRLQHSTTRLKQTTIEYLQEEVQQLPSRGEVTAFSTAITELNSKTECLTTRVSQLEQLTKKEG